MINITEKSVLDLFSCEFKLEDDSSRVTFRITALNCNGADLDCMAEGIEEGPFYIRFDKPLNLKNIREIDYMEDEPILILDRIQYKIVNSDLDYFIEDFHADNQKTLCNLIKNLAYYIRKNYTL